MGYLTFLCNSDHQHYYCYCYYHFMQLYKATYQPALALDFVTKVLFQYRQTIILQHGNGVDNTVEQNPNIFSTTQKHNLLSATHAGIETASNPPGLNYM